VKIKSDVGNPSGRDLRGPTVSEASSARALTSRVRQPPSYSEFLADVMQMLLVPVVLGFSLPPESAASSQGQWAEDCALSSHYKLPRTQVIALPLSSPVAMGLSPFVGRRRQVLDVLEVFSPRPAHRRHRKDGRWSPGTGTADTSGSFQCD